MSKRINTTPAPIEKGFPRQATLDYVWRIQLWRAFWFAAAVTFAFLYFTK